MLSGRRYEWEDIENQEERTRVRQQAINEELEDQEFALKQRYDQVARQYKQLPGSDIWRVVTTSNPTQIRKLGKHWAYDPYERIREPKEVLFRALADKNNVNFTETVISQMDYTLDLGSMEVILIDHAPIYIFDVETDKELIPINKWRRV
jgi:hypothetical protein